MCLKSNILKIMFLFWRLLLPPPLPGFGKVNLLKNRVVIEKSACISILNGAHVDVWDSPWIF